MTSKLLPCPFCGEPGEERDEKGWFACSNNDCAVWHIQALEEDWNKRAAPEAPRQQPIGWFTDDYLTDKSATTYDELTSNRWKDKGWPIQPLYAAPLSPDHSGGGAGMVVTSAAEAFSKGFNLLEQTDGKYRITMAFQNSDDAFDAYRQLAELRKYLDKVKELNQ